LTAWAAFQGMYGVTRYTNLAGVIKVGMNIFLMTVIQVIC
jgi:hypothetical protein